MQTIKKDELFHNLGGFLKSKGIELNDGSYTARIQKGCNLLSDAINATQKTVKKTKVQVDQALDQLRQSIHDCTAPKPPPASPFSKPPAPGTPPQAKSKRPGTPRAKRPSATAPIRRQKDANL
jgi:hypothetical protein